MNHDQLHEIAMLTLSKTEFSTKNDPVGLAKEIFQSYNNVIDALKVLNNDFDECEVTVFGMPQSDHSCPRKKR